MKIGIIPDIHGSKAWCNAINDNQDVDHWVFLGDYVDSWIHDKHDIVKNLRNIIAYKLKNKDKITLLLGNHDLQYLYLDPWYQCSGFNPTTAPILNKLFTKYQHLFDVATEYNGYILSHAGVTESWFNRYRKALDKYGIHLDRSNLIEWMNRGLHEGPKVLIDTLDHIGRYRGGYESNGGPFWADENELKKDPLQGVNQVVGHTVQAGTAKRVVLARGEIIIFTDTGELNNLTPVILEKED